MFFESRRKKIERMRRFCINSITKVLNDKDKIECFDAHVTLVFETMDYKSLKRHFNQFSAAWFEGLEKQRDKFQAEGEDVSHLDTVIAIFKKDLGIHA